MAKKATQVAKPKLVTVRSPKGVPFWQRHPDHPGGEVWVAGHEHEASPAVKVAKTPEVVKAIAEGRLEIVKRGQPAPQAEEKDE